MPNYKASQGWQLIEPKRTLSSTSTSETFTINENMAIIDKLKLVIRGTTTAALVLELIVNGERDAGDYRQEGHQVIDGTYAALDLQATECVLGSITELPTTAGLFTSEVEIWLAGTTLQGKTFLNSANKAQAITGVYFADAATTITELIVEVSTSSLAVGTTFELYRMRRR